MLVEAFEINLANNFIDLARYTLKLLPESVQEELKKKIPSIPLNTLEGSSIDWENHINFGLAGNCFICHRPFTREESKLMGIGPICGSWSYSFDPKDKANKKLLEKLKRKIRKRLLENKGENQYHDLIEFLPNVLHEEARIYIERETPKAIMINVNDLQSFWIPRKSCVYYFGAFFVRSWKYKEIIREIDIIVNRSKK